jgi:hypothetical protein
MFSELDTFQKKFLKDYFSEKRTMLWQKLNGEQAPSNLLWNRRLQEEMYNHKPNLSNYQPYLKACCHC